MRPVLLHLIICTLEIVPVRLLAEESAPPVEEIVIHRKKSPLKDVPEVGGPLKLSVQHTPQTVNIVNKATMNQRGYINMMEALESTPGINSAGDLPPGNPAQFVIRGFTDGQTNMVFDGVYFGPTSLNYRPQNSFNLHSFEVIRGPSSILYGEGSVGGVINMQTNDPTLREYHVNGQASYGSFNTVNTGLGATVPLGENSALRADISHSGSDGYINGANPHSNDYTVTFLTRPHPDMEVKFISNYMTDELSTYFGTPLVPGSAFSDIVPGLLTSSKGVGISKRSLWKNYNVSDPQASAQYSTNLLKLNYQLNDMVAFHNDTYFIYAKRRWHNAEVYSYIGQNDVRDALGHIIPYGNIGRDRFYVYHNQHQLGNNLYTTIDLNEGELKNRLILGQETRYIRFIRSSGYPSARYADSVSLDDPQNGYLGSFPGEDPARKSTSSMLNIAFYAEDNLTLDQLRLIGGVRYENLGLVRKNFNQGGTFNDQTSFSGHYGLINTRAGIVYDIVPTLSIYASFTTGQNSPGSSLFFTNRGDFTRPSDSTQEEIGVKGSFLQEKIFTKLALYNIDRNHVLVETSRNTTTTASGQYSRGIEFEGTARLTPNMRIEGNISYVYSRFKSGYVINGIDAGHNEAPNVAPVTANIWLSYTQIMDLPIDAGIGLRWVSSRKGDYANTLKLDNYAILNMYSVWNFTDNARLFGRIHNVTNKHYIQWASTSYPSELFLGSPRAFTLDLQFGF